MPLSQCDITDTDWAKWTLTYLLVATYVNSTGVRSREGREDRLVAAGDGGGAVAVRGLLLGGARAHRRHAPRQVLRAVRADLPRRTGETLKIIHGQAAVYHSL